MKMIKKIVTLCCETGFEYEMLKLPLTGPEWHTQGIELYPSSFVTSALDTGQ
jgi:hypothetical protein